MILAIRWHGVISPTIIVVAVAVAAVLFLGGGGIILTYLRYTSKCRRRRRRMGGWRRSPFFVLLFLPFFTLLASPCAPGTEVGTGALAHSINGGLGLGDIDGGVFLVGRVCCGR